MSVLLILALVAVITAIIGGLLILAAALLDDEMVRVWGLLCCISGGILGLVTFVVNLALLS